MVLDIHSVAVLGGGPGGASAPVTVSPAPPAKMRYEDISLRLPPRRGGGGSGQHQFSPVVLKTCAEQHLSKGCRWDPSSRRRPPSWSKDFRSVASHDLMKASERRESIAGLRSSRRSLSCSNPKLPLQD